ncbi:hypothetical protein K461DRAFT_278580 [Myriangium duriaei CBS 260.36]|uniref:Uncharacterized protein n=1 Tax=Myriangium duriaei CBS 260.36 TaxID=1168546 RepID=A0A9P4MM39_9PEZI|nr:hypothetical protein K461DRAFT_278580 [Myriangium duriaei CBS 260.36]
MQPQTLASLKQGFFFIMPAVVVGNFISDSYLSRSLRWRRLEDKYTEVSLQISQFG